MPKTKTRQNVYPQCGTHVTDPYKTWELVAPFPDKKSRITVTVFGMYDVPNAAKIQSSGK